MKLYLDSNNQLVCNGFYTFANDFFETLVVEWYSSVPVIQTTDLQEGLLVVFCYNGNFEELRNKLQKNTLPEKVIQVVLIVSGEINNLSQLVSYGITGFFSLQCDQSEFRAAFQKILHNQNYYCQEIWNFMLDGVEERTEFSEIKQQLTKREIEVVEKLIQGKTTQEISIELDLSPQTIQTHRKNSFKKLNVHSLAELLLLEMKQHIFIQKQ